MWGSVLVRLTKPSRPLWRWWRRRCRGWCGTRCGRRRISRAFWTCWRCDLRVPLSCARVSLIGKCSTAAVLSRTRLFAMVVWVMGSLHTLRCVPAMTDREADQRQGIGRRGERKRRLCSLGTDIPLSPTKPPPGTRRRPRTAAGEDSVLRTSSPGAGHSADGTHPHPHTPECYSGGDQRRWGCGPGTDGSHHLHARGEQSTASRDSAQTDAVVDL